VHFSVYRLITQSFDHRLTIEHRLIKFLSASRLFRWISFSKDYSLIVSWLMSPLTFSSMKRRSFSIDRVDRSCSISTVSHYHGSSPWKRRRESGWYIGIAAGKLRNARFFRLQAKLLSFNRDVEWQKPKKTEDDNSSLSRPWRNETLCINFPPWYSRVCIFHKHRRAN
jgi:hypothetical protein